MAKQSLASFLSGLDPTTGDPATSVGDLSEKQITQELTAAQQAEKEGFGGLSIKGATPKQTAEVQQALNAGYSPSDIAKGIFPKASDPNSQLANQKAQTQAYEQQLKDVASSPWTTAAQALTSSMTADLNAVAPDVSGASGPAAENAAAASATGMLGLAPGSSAGQWLASQTAAAQQNAAPVAAAMNAEGQTYANAAGPISKAILQWGQDNAEQNLTAPGAAWLNAGLSHIASNLSYYGVVPATAVSSMPYSVAHAIQESGGVPGSSGAGTVPVQNITQGPGGTSVVKGGTSSAAPTASGVLPTGAGITPGS